MKDAHAFMRSVPWKSFSRMEPTYRSSGIIRFMRRTRAAIHSPTFSDCCTLMHTGCLRSHLSRRRHASGSRAIIGCGIRWPCISHSSLAIKGIRSCECAKMRCVHTQPTIQFRSQRQTRRRSNKQDLSRTARRQSGRPGYAQGLARTLTATPYSRRFRHGACWTSRE